MTLLCITGKTVQLLSLNLSFMFPLMILWTIKVLAVMEKKLLENLIFKAVFFPVINNLFGEVQEEHVSVCVCVL